MTSEIWICFDTETTGLIHNTLIPIDRQPRVIEFAAVLFSIDENGEGDELEVLDFLCDPGVKITDEITKITGIKPQDVHGMLSFRNFIPQVVKIFNKASRRVAHNLVFDENQLMFEFLRANTQFLHSINKQKRLCSVEATEHLKSYRLKLSDLYAYLFDEQLVGSHRALVDVRATVRCVRELKKRGEI